MQRLNTVPLFILLHIIIIIIMAIHSKEESFMILPFFLIFYLFSGSIVVYSYCIVSNGITTGVTHLMIWIHLIFFPGH